MACSQPAWPLSSVGMLRRSDGLARSRRRACGRERAAAAEEAAKAAGALGRCGQARCPSRSTMAQGQPLIHREFKAAAVVRRQRQPAAEEAAKATAAQTRRAAEAKSVAQATSTTTQGQALSRQVRSPKAAAGYSEQADGDGGGRSCT
jgi:hypothetical protein